MIEWRKNLISGYKRVIALDTETSDGHGHGSVDNKTGFIALIQVNLGGEDVRLLRPTKENLKFVKSLVEDKDTVVIMHNASFDLGFLAQVGIYPRNVFDTQIASQILYSGYTTPDEATKEIQALQKVVSDDAEESELFDTQVLSEIAAYKHTKATRFGHSLAVVLRRELGIIIPKEARMSDWSREPLSEAQKEYAINDVKYLITLGKVLEEKLITSGLKDVALLEMELVKVTAFLEFTGFSVDEESWQKKVFELEKELAAVKEDLERKIGEKLARDQGNVGLFGLVPVPVNLNSSSQMAKILGLPDVQEQTLEHANEYISDPELLAFLGEYKEYKKLQKLVSTYGTSYIGAIYGGRLRGNFLQTQTATGRYSSRNPNLQNVPPDFLKSMVRGGKLPNGNPTIPVSADYSQVELRVLATLSGDERFIEATMSSDLHSQTARMVFNIPDEEPVPKDLRKAAKCVHPWSLVNVAYQTEDGEQRRFIHMEELFDMTDALNIPEEDYDSFIGSPDVPTSVSVNSGEYKEIIDRYISLPSRLTAVITRNGITLTTPDHRFKTADTGSFVRAADLSPGEVLFTSKHFIDYDFFSTGKEIVEFTDDGRVIRKFLGGNSFVELTTTDARVLGYRYHEMDIAVEVIYTKTRDSWKYEILSSLVDDYKIPSPIINSAVLSSAYIEGVRRRWTDWGWKLRKGYWRIPINDDNLIFLSQLLSVSKPHPTKGMWVDKVEDGYIYITSKRPEVDGEVLITLDTDGMYQTLDITVDGGAYALNGVVSHNTVNFGLPYGVSAKGLVARGFFDDIESAEKAIDSWRKSFPVAWEFLQKSADDAENGATRDAIGRRRNYELPKKPSDFARKNSIVKSLREMLHDYGTSPFEIGKYESYEEFKESDLVKNYPSILEIIGEPEFSVIREIQKYNAQIAAIRRQGQNMPIQSTSASITKLALVKIYKKMLERGDFFPTLTVHDSIFFEVDAKKAVEIAEIITEIMMEAAEEVLPGLVAPVDVDFGWMEEFVCYSCGEKVKKFNMYVEDGEIKKVDPDKVLCDSCKEKAGS